MKPVFIKILLVMSGAFLFNVIFWQQKLGINTLLFDLFIISSVFYLYPAAFKKPAVRWLLAVHIITVAAVLIHNTILSKLAFSVTLLLLVVFVQYLHRSVWYAAGSALMNFLLVIPAFFTNATQLNQQLVKMYGVRKALRFLIIPVLLLLIFYGLYNFSNTIFSSIMNDTAIALKYFFARFFEWFSLPRLIFFSLGLFVTGGLLLKSKVGYFSEKDMLQINMLTRKKQSCKMAANRSISITGADNGPVCQWHACITK